MIQIQRRYKENIEKIKEEDIDLVKINLIITRKVCCGGREKKSYDLGWVKNPKDMKLTTVKEYSIQDRVLEVWIEPWNFQAGIDAVFQKSKNTIYAGYILAPWAHR